MDRFSTEIQCKDFTFLTTKSESAQAGVSSKPAQSTAQNNQDVVSEPLSEDDDLPF